MHLLHPFFKNFLGETPTHPPYCERIQTILFCFIWFSTVEVKILPHCVYRRSEFWRQKSQSHDWEDQHQKWAQNAPFASMFKNFPGEAPPPGPPPKGGGIPSRTLPPATLRMDLVTPPQGNPLDLPLHRKNNDLILPCGNYFRIWKYWCLNIQSENNSNNIECFIPLAFAIVNQSILLRKFPENNCLVDRQINFGGGGVKKKLWKKDVKNEHFMGNNEISNEKWNFFKLKLGVSKLLECKILHQIPQSFWGSWAAPRPPAVRAPRVARCATRFASRTPLHSFLPTGMNFLCQSDIILTINR